MTHDGGSSVSDVGPFGDPTARLAAFRRHFGLSASRAGPAREVRDVARAFARIPYENLTKILAVARAGGAAGAPPRRGPATVLAEHVAFGAGGTCFSLTALLLDLLRAAGHEAVPVLADRRYGPDTHCAVLVTLDGDPHLLDPGYLITDPVPLRALDGAPEPASDRARSGVMGRVPVLGSEALPESDPKHMESMEREALRGAACADREVRMETGFNTQVLHAAGPGRVALATERRGARSERLVFKTDPVDDATFRRAWDASFGFEMMRQAVLTRVDGGRQRYLQGNRLLVRDASRAERRELDPGALPLEIARAFGVDARLASAALSALEARGERPEGGGGPGS